MNKIFNFQTCQRPGGDLYGIRPGFQCRQGVPVSPADLVSEIRKARERGISSDQIRRLNEGIKLKYKNPNSPEAQSELVSKLREMKPRTNNYKDLVNIGKEGFTEGLVKVSSLLGDFKGGTNDLVMGLAQTKSKIDRAKNKKDLEEAEVQHDKFKNLFQSYQEAQQIMEQIKNRVLGRGDERKAKENASLVNIEDGLDPKKIRSFLKDLYQISNNQVDTLEKIYSSRDRPFAAKPGVLYPGEEKDLTGRINVGNTLNKKLEAALWHEFGHHIEYSVEEYREAAYQWMRSRTTGSPVLLNSLVKSNRFDPDEKAFPGNFGLGEYVGKYSSSRNTEVISMGLERFFSSSSMVEFYQKDPEHFLLIMGILNTL